MITNQTYAVAQNSGIPYLGVCFSGDNQKSMLLDFLVSKFMEMMKTEGHRAYNPKYAKHCATVAANETKAEPKAKPKAKSKPASKPSEPITPSDKAPEDREVGTGEEGAASAANKVSIAELLSSVGG